MTLVERTERSTHRHASGEIIVIRKGDPRIRFIHTGHILVESLFPALGEGLQIRIRPTASSMGFR